MTHSIRVPEASGSPLAIRGWHGAAWPGSVTTLARLSVHHCSIAGALPRRPGSRCLLQVEGRDDAAALLASFPGPLSSRTPPEKVGTDHHPCRGLAEAATWKAEHAAVQTDEASEC